MPAFALAFSCPVPHPLTSHSGNPIRVRGGGPDRGRARHRPPLASQARGHDPSAHVLACFGGAGGQHACAIARALGMDTVHVHRYVWEWCTCRGWGAGFGRHPHVAEAPRLRRHSGLLSALGLALADVVHEAQEPCSLPYAPETFVQLDQRLSRLEEQCVDALRAQGFPRWGSQGEVEGGAGPGRGLAASQPPPSWPSRPTCRVARSGRAGGRGTGVPGAPCVSGPPAPLLQVPDQHRELPASPLSGHRLCPHGVCPPAPGRCPLAPCWRLWGRLRGEVCELCVPGALAGGLPARP